MSTSEVFGTGFEVDLDGIASSFVVKLSNLPEIIKASLPSSNPVGIKTVTFSPSFSGAFSGITLSASLSGDTITFTFSSTPPAVEVSIGVTLFYVLS